MLEALIWLLLLELIGLAAFAPAFALFGGLPERGFCFTKPLGLLLIGYFSWQLGILGLPFTAWLAWLILLGGFGLLNGWLLLRNGRKLANEIRAWAGQNAGLLLTIQLIFWSAYAYLVLLRSFAPAIRESEKFMDYAFVQGLYVSDRLPATDLWLSGYPINYYYFGHLMVALLTKMSGINPAIAFNLGMPAIFGMAALGSFGLGFNLVKAARKEVSWQKAALFGGLALFMICLMGNLDTIRQLLSPRLYNNETGLGPNFVFNWISPSRVIYDYMPNLYGDTTVWQWIETINEFPMFSFVLADLHPHVMALPFAMLVVGLALNVWLLPQGDTRLSFRKIEGLLHLAIIALASGALYFLNTWDYPTYSLLLGGALVWRKVASVTRRKRLEGLKWAGLLLGLSLGLYLPYHLTFVSPVGGNQLSSPLEDVPGLGTLVRAVGFVGWDRTPLFGYFLIFGIFVLPALSFLAIKLYPYFRDPYTHAPEPKPSKPPSRFAGALLAAGVLVILFGQLGFHLLGWPPTLTALLTIAAYPLLLLGLEHLRLKYLARWRKAQAERPLIVVVGGLAVILVLQGWYLRFELLGLLYVPVVLAGLLLIFEGKRPGSDPQRRVDYFVLGLLFVGLALNLGTEIVFLRDAYNNRMNTLFKFYYQAWLLFGLVAAYGAWRMTEVFKRNAPLKSWKRLWAGVFATLLLLGLVYPALATWERSERFSKVVGLDGSLWLRDGSQVGSAMTADYNAIEWLVEQRKADKNFSGTILEATGIDWKDWSRVSTFSGLPALIGEVTHESLWRTDQGLTRPNAFSCVNLSAKYQIPSSTIADGQPGFERAELKCREALVDYIYSTPDAVMAEKLLREAGVKYVYVGLIEQGLSDGRGDIVKKYSPESLQKFESFMRVIYRRDGVSIYSF